MKLVGVNLTVPHKLLAVAMMDVLDGSATAWGAVNTVRFESRDSHGAWRPVAELAQPAREVRTHGFNTDAEAIARALREDLGLDVKHASVLLLGAGGAGRTAALKLAADGARHLFLVNRTWAKAAALETEIHERWPRVQVTVGYPAGAVELVMNATSVGLKADDPLPFDQQHFQFGQARMAYDMIYRPAETRSLGRPRKPDARWRTASACCSTRARGRRNLERPQGACRGHAGGPGKERLWLIRRHAEHDLRSALLGRCAVSFLVGDFLRLRLDRRRFVSTCAFTACRWEKASFRRRRTVLTANTLFPGI